MSTPEQAIALGKLREQSESFKVIQDREFYLANELRYCQEILGYRDMRPYPHGEILAMLDGTETRNKGVFMPRGSLKSTTVTVGKAMLRALKMPDIRILIDSSVYTNSVAFLRTIRSHAEENERHVRLFGVLGSKGQRQVWNEDELVFNTRKNKSLKEATFSASGIDTPKTSKHYDLIIMDDIIDDSNWMSDAVDKIMHDHYRRLFFLLDPSPKSELWIAGCRYRPTDIYGWIMATQKKIFSFYVKSVYDGPGSPSGPEDDHAGWNGVPKDHSSLLMPEFLSWEKVEQFRMNQFFESPEMFAAQYLNKPISSQANFFDSEHEVWWENEAELPPMEQIVMTVDYAVSTEKKADESAITIVGRCANNKLWVLDAWNDRVDASDLIDRIFYYWLIWEKRGLDQIGVESGALERAIRPFMETEMQNRGIWMVVTPIKGWNRRSKPARIKRLVPYWKNRAIILKRGMDDLRFQLIEGGQRDDLKDALAYSLDLLNPSAPDELGENTPAEQQAGVTEDVFEKHSALMAKFAEEDNKRKVERMNSDLWEDEVVGVEE